MAVVYHWKHGWIPLTHEAALSKAKGNHDLAKRYLADAPHARGIQTRQDVAKAARDLPNIGTASDRVAAKHELGKAAARIGAQDMLPKSLQPASGGKGPADAAGAFRMGGPELRQHAANGSTVAQTELDRRAAKHAEPSAPHTQPPAAAAQAKSLTPAELHAQNRGDLKVGDEVSVRAAGGTRIGTVTAFDESGRAHIHVAGHGTVVRTAADVSKDIHPATRAAHGRSVVGDFRKTPTANMQAALKMQSTSAERKDAMRAELKRRGVAPDTEHPAQAPANPARIRIAGGQYRGEAGHTITGTDTRGRAVSVFVPGDRAAADRAAANIKAGRGAFTNAPNAAVPAGRDVTAENAALAPTGHTITSKTVGTRADGTPQAMHTQHAANGERIGSVIERRTGGGYQASYQGHVIGVFRSRKEAHQALADMHAEKAQADKAKVDAAAKRHANAVPVGIWQPQTPQSDGTRFGDAAAAKIKQSFKYNNHTVHIETGMTKDQTKAFLDDVHAVLLKSGNMDSEGIKFHVPSGDKKFRRTRRGTRRGTTGGYVRHGQRTIFVNPKVANGDIAGSFAGPGSNPGGQMMPASEWTNDRQYVMTHELGHVLDAQHGHTKETTHLGSRQVEYTSSREEATALHREQRSQLSRYGQTNVAEGYAEAYAQWIHGGPGINAAADAFAAKYGWAVPKWYREGRTRA
jgi:hypothetical protein